MADCLFSPVPYVLYILLVLFLFGLQHVHGNENHIVADIDQCLEQLCISGGRKRNCLHYFVSRFYVKLLKLLPVDVGFNFNPTCTKFDCGAQSYSPLGRVQHSLRSLWI